MNLKLIKAEQAVLNQLKIHKTLGITMDQLINNLSDSTEADIRAAFWILMNEHDIEILKSGRAILRSEKSVDKWWF